MTSSIPVSFPQISRKIPLKSIFILIPIGKFCYRIKNYFDFQRTTRTFCNFLSFFNLILGPKKTEDLNVYKAF